MNIDATNQLAHQRLRVLELAQRLNIALEVCRQWGISRIIFYAYTRLETFLHAYRLNCYFE